MRKLALLIAAGLMTLLAGCVIKSSCANDADCGGGQPCCEPEGVCLEVGSCCDSDDCSLHQGCLLLEGSSVGSCVPRCDRDADCAADEICVGVCSPPECHEDEDCPNDRFRCVEGRCEAKGPLFCPSDMVPVEDEFCIDIYEASRPDATATSPGSESTVATSRPGVKPWQVATNGIAQSACEAAGKSLCSEEEWFQACGGPEGGVYGYGDTYDPVICNGIDTYCHCGAGSSCESRDPCPFEHCFRTCGASFRVEPTAYFSDCTNGYGLYDINGNLWEHVLGGNDTRVRGGAFNCSDSKQFHRCDYIPGNWSPLALGFRCCSTGLMMAEDGGPVGGDPGPDGAGDSLPGDSSGGD